MFNHAISQQGSPKYLSSDNDLLFLYHQWQANLRILDVEEIKAVPYVPLSHPFVERPIGTVRREFLDQILFWNTTDLQRKLDSFRDYYNHQRVHKSRDGRPPAETAKHDAAADCFGWQRCCHGLHELPIAM
jgi:transposase InsO family protein